MVFASFDEIASVSFEPYNFDFVYKYYPITQDFLDDEERDEFVFKKAQELVTEWQKR